MTPAKKKSGSGSRKASSKRKEMLEHASIASVPLPKIKIHPPEEPPRSAIGGDDETRRRPDRQTALDASSTERESADQVVARLTEGLGEPPTEKVTEMALTDDELYRIAKHRQRVSAAKERKRLANQKDIPKRDVYTLSTHLIHRLNQWSKGWSYQGKRVNLSLSNCAAYLLYETVDKEAVREKAREFLSPRDHKRWNHALAHPNDHDESARRRGPAERRVIFQLNRDLIRKIKAWSEGFGNHIIVSQSQSVGFLLTEGLDLWKAKPKPVKHIHRMDNNYWKLSLFHPADPRGGGAK
jgi:hypothetical protein